jgi:hypothetical protein
MMRLATAVALMSIVACGPGGGSKPGDDDDDTPSDANNMSMPDAPSPDAPPMPAAGIGTACTPDQANPQGTCPAGFECLNLQGATTPWCSKTCTSGAGDTCMTGYTGPGKATCILAVTPAGGGNPQNYCAVVCQDMTGNNQICPAGVCNGMCPGSLACTGDLNGTINGMPQVVGQVCE